MLNNLSHSLFELEFRRENDPVAFLGNSHIIRVTSGLKRQNGSRGKLLIQMKKRCVLPWDDQVDTVGNNMPMYFKQPAQVIRSVQMCGMQPLFK